MNSQTKPKHTPRPWTVDTSGMYLAIRGNLSDRKHLAHEEVVARPYHLDDAALISAAPCMYENLESALIALRSGCETEDDKNGLIELIEKTLAKARGES